MAGGVDEAVDRLESLREAGCERVYLWPLGDEARQLELVAEVVAPQLQRG